jgi:hypothetical protein
MQSPAHGRRPHGHLRRAPGAGGHPAGLVPPYSAASQGSAGVAAFGESPAVFVYQLMLCMSIARFSLTVVLCSWPTLNAVAFVLVLFTLSRT